MAPPSEAILRLSIPDPAYQKILEGSQPPALPTLEIPKLRDVTNKRKASARQELGGPPDGVKEYEIEIPVRDGQRLAATVTAPESTEAGRPIYVDFHGGGYCIGSSKDCTVTNRQLADKLGLVVVSVDYRLAPEYAFPVAVYDAQDSVRWIYLNASTLDGDPTAGFVVGGTSSGGNLAMAVVYLNRDDESPVKITGQFLSVPPVIPPPVVPAKYKDEYVSIEQNKGLSPPAPELVDLFMEAYKPNLNSPLFVPFNHSRGHRGIPPTYLQICGLDGLRDEELIYERVLREDAGVLTRKDVYSGLPHHFWEFFPQLVEQAIRRHKDTIDGFNWLLGVGARVGAGKP